MICVYSLACFKAPSLDFDEVVTTLQNQVDTTTVVVRATGTTAAKNELSVQTVMLQNGIKAISYVKQLRSLQLIPQMNLSSSSAAKNTSPDTNKFKK